MKAPNKSVKLLANAVGDTPGSEVKTGTQLFSFASRRLGREKSCGAPFSPSVKKGVMTQEPTQALADFAASLSLETVPVRVQACAKGLVLDPLAMMHVMFVAPCGATPLSYRTMSHFRDSPK